MISTIIAFLSLTDFILRDIPRAISATAVAEDAIKLIVVSIGVKISIFKNENIKAKMTDNINGL